VNNPTWCDCFEQDGGPDWKEMTFHPETQDTTCDGWKHLLDLVEQAAADKRELFAPMRELTAEERSQIVTLPPTIAKLTAVKHLLLYHSPLIRIPPEIGAMTQLEEFTPYTSYRLHWFPYEITRCPQLQRSSVSTRALYGNYKYRPPFPKLSPGGVSLQGLDRDHLPPGTWGSASIRTCSVCDRSLEGAVLRQVWISLRVAGDVLPLLVNACSEACIQSLPRPPDGYISGPHTGGLSVKQPPADY